LIDLSGHTGHNRLPLFARKPAPLQIGWLGYWATTALHAMNYVICDPYCISADDKAFFVEQLWALPDTRLCFTPPPQPVAINRLPALTAGHITLGCFNNLAKLNDTVIALWARALQRLGNARLLLKARQLHEPSIRAATAARFAAHGIGAEQLLLEGPSPRAEYFSAYNRIDIALDPFPFTGATTSIESLWMGVPFVTLRGDRMLARQGESILQNVAMPDWIAADADDYIEKLAVFAADLPALVDLRINLRARLLASPLCDAPRFAHNLELALREMWRQYCSAKS
jgi:protein O-GlcNAc transferase